MIQSLFFIFVFCLAVYFFLQSPFFGVREINVIGVKRLTSEEVLALSGLTKGVNIFKANIKESAAKVALHPMVRDVEISRELPETVNITVAEREPIGLGAGDGYFVMISDDGYYLSKVTDLSTVNLPIITGLGLGSTGPGQKIPDKRLPAALDYLLAMPLNVRAAVSELNVADLNNIRMFTVDKAEIRLGSDERINEKIILYQQIISQKYDNSIQYMDISYKGNPVIKFNEPAQQEKEKHQ